MNAHEFLIGQAFTRNGVRHTILEVSGATVVAAMLTSSSTERVSVPLADVLDALEVTRIDVTELPRDDQRTRKVS